MCSLSVKDYLDEILSYHQTLILAPTASGKTQMVIKNLVKKGKRVLLITSRKVIRDASQLDAQDAKTIDNITIIHQWQIEGNTSINLADYDFLVVDECHLFFNDTFTTAAWHLEQYIRRLPCHITLILMSALSDMVRVYITKEIVPGIHFIDLTGKVKSVNPKSVCIITSAQMHAMIRRADENNKIIVYCETVKAAYKYEEKYLTKGRTDVQASTAQPEKRTDTQQELAAREEFAQRYLTETGHLPPDINVFFTTSMNREGLNLFDQHVKTIISELISKTDLVQIAGRHRGGVELLCIVSDKSKRNPYHDRKSVAAVTEMVKELNFMLDNIKTENDLVKQQIIEALQSGARHYADYIVFGEGRFHVCKGKFAAMQIMCEEYDQYSVDLESFVCKCLGCELQEPIDIRSVLEPYMNRRFFANEQNMLLQQLNDAGFCGGRLKLILEENGYEMKHAGNYNWYEIHDPSGKLANGSKSYINEDSHSQPLSTKMDPMPGIFPETTLSIKETKVDLGSLFIDPNALGAVQLALEDTGQN